MKKLISILLALTLVLSLSVAAFAAEENIPCIEINGVTKGTTYTIYRMMILESFEKGAAYSYKIDPQWAAFFGTGGPGASYIEVDESGYVTWKAAEDETSMAAFAKMALQYAKDHGIAADESYTVPQDYAGTTYLFNNLELGWYLVDSNAGALCTLTSTDWKAIVNPKNKVPTVDKTVKEDLTGEYGDNNTADIGQTVEYRTTVYVAAGAQNYALHDKMESTLNFTHDPANGMGVTHIEIKHTGNTTTTLTEGTHYSVHYAASACKKAGCDHTGHALKHADCTFEVDFFDTVVASLKDTDAIQIYYNAILNRYAESGKENDETTDYNMNESWLEYGEEHYTTHDKTETYTFSLDIVKTDSSNKLLKGAKFKIYGSADGTDEIKVTELRDATTNELILDANGNKQYRRARDTEPGVEIEVTNGKVTIHGFDNGTYYLEETQPPAGYNELAARQEFSIANANNSASIEKRGDDYYFLPGPTGVHVINKTGSMLPETGAAGTFAFITLGTIMVLAAGVLLVTKKRMSMIRE